MSSGVSVEEKCREQFKELKLGKTCGYVIFKISDDTTRIEVDCAGGKGACYEEFKQKLVEAGGGVEGRYGVFDVPVDNRTVLAFIMWVPENANIKQKMLYTSSKQAIKNILEGIGPDIQCNDLDDLAYCGIADKCKSKYK